VKEIGVENEEIIFEFEAIKEVAHNHFNEIFTNKNEVIPDALRNPISSVG
jgi:hypothetical protein